VDDAFYFDLKARCATYNVFVRPACYSLAWTYYQAVKTFGSLQVSTSQLAGASAQKTAGPAAQPAHTAALASVSG
jgi:phospholipase A2-like protein